jgi:HK97 gp10 family phage protein
LADVRVTLDRGAILDLLSGPAGPVAAELTKRALRVNNRAKQLCPVDTGRLRSSIAMRLEAEAGRLIAVIGTNVEYAPYVEFGTRHMRAQPFLRPALDAAK